jgi:hypothetical protein
MGKARQQQSAETGRSRPNTKRTTPGKNGLLKRRDHAV